MVSRKRSPTRIDLPVQARASVEAALDEFCQDQDIELSALRLTLLADFLQDRVGHLFYNQGVQDAMAAATLAQSRLHEDLDLLRKLG